MPLIQATHLQKSFPAQDLLTDISFSINEGERVGLVGRNGCGKSTLFSILKGESKSDGGDLFKKKNLRVGLLRQEPVLSENSGEAESMIQYYAGRLLVENMDFERPEILSGGEKNKLALSALLSEEPELLLLDEPTNHMDHESAEVLMQLLRECDGAMILISHDRYFLDGTVDRIWEIEDGRLHEYNGNYSFYRDEKKRRFQEQFHRYESAKKEEKRIQNTIRRKQEWAQKAHRESTIIPSGTPKMGYKEKARARAKKMDSQAKNFIKKLERHTERAEERPRQETSVQFSISAGISSGKRILEAENLSASYGARTLFSNTTFHLNRSDHVAVFGPNGCGKSTLVSLLTGEKELDSGNLWTSQGRKPHVIYQNIENLSHIPEPSLEYIRAKVGKAGGHERALLHRLGISTRHLETPVKDLSYGEKMKLLLAEPILLEKEFLILDEPTHHLDLPTREALEDTLSQYPGTLLLISHDIYFLRQVCEKVLLFSKNRFLMINQSFREYMDEKIL